MSTILNRNIITNAKAAVSNYAAQIDSLNTELKNAMGALTPGNFEGEAATGYAAFYTGKIAPVVTETLPELIKGIEGILSAVETQLMDTVDPGLRTGNENLL